MPLLLQDTRSAIWVSGRTLQGPGSPSLGQRHWQGDTSLVPNDGRQRTGSVRGPTPSRDDARPCSTQVTQPGPQRVLPGQGTASGKGPTRRKGPTGARDQLSVSVLPHPSLAFGRG